MEILFLVAAIMFLGLALAGGPGGPGPFDDITK